MAGRVAVETKGKSIPFDSEGFKVNHAIWVRFLSPEPEFVCDVIGSSLVPTGSLGSIPNT